MAKLSRKRKSWLQWRPGISKQFLLVATVLLAVFGAWKIYTQFLATNTPEENTKIIDQAVKLRDHGKCDTIRGETHIANPANLYEPIVLTQGEARERCHGLVEHYLDQRQPPDSRD